MLKYKVIEALVDETKKYIEDNGYLLSYIYYDPNNQRSDKKISDMIAEIIFGKPNVVLPDFVKYTISDYGKNIFDKIKDVEIVKIPISKINITQKIIFTKPLMKKTI